MLKPFRVLDDSIRHFVIGLGPAILMAFVCLAIQVVVPLMVLRIWNAVFPPEPPQDFDSFMNGLFAERDWLDQAGELLGHTAWVSILFFFHVLVALILTSWLLRKHAGFNRLEVVRRALRRAGVLTGAAAVVFGAALFVDDFLPATRYIRFDFGAAALIGLWFGGTALLLPARLMGHQPPAAASGMLRTTFIVTIVLVPWFFLSEVAGRPIRHCHECWGLFEGGIFAIPMLGAYLLGLTVSSAAISAAACLPVETPAATAHAT